MAIRNLIVSVVVCAFALAITVNSAASDKVNITAEVPFVDVMHKGKLVRIERIQDKENIIDLEYAITSRACPPYCIQPATLAEGVETIAELEMLDFLKKITAGDNKIVVIDSREEHWLAKGMIPGSINIPWQHLYNKTATAKKITEILQFRFGVVKYNGLWNFQDAKTLVFYCNGPWCGQSATNIRALLALGYPAHKLKWYRGGIQAWKSLGLTTVKP